MPHTPFVTVVTLFLASLLHSEYAVAQNVKPQAEEFNESILPLLDKYCVECHSTGEMHGLDFLFEHNSLDLTRLSDLYASVSEQIANRQMPPRHCDQPSDAERTLIVDWFKNNLPAAAFDRIAAYVINVYEDRHGHLWFGTMNRGAARFDGMKLTYFTTENGLPSNTVPSFAEDAQGNLWVGTHDGICRFDGAKFVQFGNEHGLPPGEGGVSTDRAGNIWANMNGGLFRFDGSTFSAFNLPIVKEEISSYAIFPGDAFMRLQDRQGNLWFSTDGYGAFKFDGTSFQRFTKQDGLCSNNVTNIVEDSSGNIWFACTQSYQPEMTSDGGVCLYDGTAIRKFPDVKGLSSNDIYTIYEDKSKQMWIGATRVGAYRYDGRSFTLFNKTDRVSWTRNFGVQGMVEDSSDQLWFGFSGGLFRFDGKMFINVGKSGPWK